MSDLIDRRVWATMENGERYGVTPPLANGVGATFAWFALLDDAVGFATPEGLDVWDLWTGRLIWRQRLVS